jgi:hypothetical protein
MRSTAVPTCCVQRETATQQAVWQQHADDETAVCAVTKVAIRVCKHVCIYVQGEEATVIVLSLVRSREDGNIGFLRLQV